MTARSHHVAILGCGVIGLSTGLAILEAQPDGPNRSKTRVTIVAKELPGSATPADQKHSAEYASVWAGGHHVSDAKTERELRHDKVTFDRMSMLAQDKPWRTQKVDSSSAFGEPLLPITKPAASSPASAIQGREPLVWVHQTELFERRDPSQSTRPPYQGVLDWYPDVSSHHFEMAMEAIHKERADNPLSLQFKELPPASLAPRFGWGCTFSTIDINVPVYLDWLLERFLQLGGRVVVSKANSLQHAVRIAASSTGSRAVCRDTSTWTSVPPVDALVVSPGLGARSIVGIEDLAVHPQRGQVVVVNAPWLSVDEGNRWQNLCHELPGVSVVRPQGGREVYVIPRGDGTVVCGGTRIVDEWDPTPRAETTKTILERCLKIMPQLVDPRKRNALIEPRVEDIEVLGVNVGLRPARRGGVRLEKAQKDVDGAKVIFNYGYGGAGYQASWGAALEAKKQLVDEALGLSSATPSKARL
ncbi:related to D-amino acid oxidase [Moesziomyces antarcticus]|uniref:Related to D-amino acid oxidase n=1 Tax=Pseudozyma antarctica TaxID=84753 RepID=A0A5C3FGC4_PSEA2|nr:related to D-amino acid oxidase [Moesziomyces antarcticus]